MEEEIKQIHFEVKELCKAVNNISQFATIISERLVNHDKKLDVIISKLDIFPKVSPEERCIQNETNLPLSKTLSTDSKFPDDADTSRNKNQLGEKEKFMTEENPTNSLNKSNSACMREKNVVRAQASTSRPTTEGLFPYNMSTPSIPLLNIETAKPKTDTQTLTPCKSSPAISLNNYYDARKEKVRFAHVQTLGSDTGGDRKSGFQASPSGSKQSSREVSVNDVDDPFQTGKSEFGKISESNSNLDINSDSKLSNMLYQANNNESRTEQDKLVVERDKKRANSTILSPTLASSSENNRRASYAGITGKQTRQSEDMAADNTTIKKAVSNKNSSSKTPQEPAKSTKQNDHYIPGALQRIFDVQRQASTSSTASGHSGIDIVMGSESDSENEDVEIKMCELPKPIFCHRTVTVKNSTYKHFYELKELIGGGRFGRVYRCVEKKTGLQLAAKCFVCKKSVTKPLLKAKSLQRTQNLKTKRTQQEPVDKDDVSIEISIMNQIDHENIVKLYDAYENDNTMTLILEYLAGGELFERVIADQSQLTELDALLFMKQIVIAIQYLHKNLILHLDLKPENILCLNRSTHHIKIIDFGLARKYHPRQKLIVQWGTPEFMAPEMFNYGAVSFPSDMWSLGIICYILLSGISPFLGEDDRDTMDNIVDCEWDFDEEPFKKVSEEAKDFVSRLLVEEKSGRMSAAQCLRHDWLAKPITSTRTKALMNKSQLKNFMARMQWKASIAAVSAANWLKQKVNTVTENVLSSRDSAV